ncbi:hypothetical protein ACX93W_02015 [Paenibacillus sp. CAU 1782]
MTLNGREKRDLLIQAGIQAIPYVGGSLSTLYYGHKQEVRFKRIESFYEEIKEELERLHASIPAVETHDPNELMSLIEQLHDNIESEHLEEKRRYYKNYYIRILKSPVIRNNYDQRKMFLDILRSLTLTQIEIFQFLIEQPAPVIDRGISRPGYSETLISGSIEQLKILGLVDSQLHGIVIGSQSGINASISASQLGKEFHRFCMRSIISP